MPGFVGFTSSGLDRKVAFDAIAGMQTLLDRIPGSEKSALFCDPNVCAGYTAAPLVPRLQSCWADQVGHVWFDGEFHNRSEAAKLLGVPFESDAALVGHAFRQGREKMLLRELDGSFAGAYYDSQKRRVSIFGDRHGLRHLYWSVQGGQFAWASEVKAFLAYPEFRPTLSKATLINYFDVGYALGDETWFNEVKVLPPASILTWNLQAGKYDLEDYWSWSELQQLNVQDEREVIEELGHRFIRAVQKRCEPGGRSGVSLSGGLDSRAVLAAMKMEEGVPLHAVSFGQATSDDLQIATRCATVKGATIHYVDINTANWLEPRISNVWATDGLLNLMHMHGADAFGEAREYMDVCLTGYLGDATIGGSYLHDPRFTELEKIDNRGRRWVRLGEEEVMNCMVTRTPFFDNAFLDLTMSVPPLLRKSSVIYIDMLLHYFPDLFREIPWQKTMCPVTWLIPRGRRKWSSPVEIYHMAYKRAAVTRSKWRGTRTYTNYPGWIRSSPSKQFFEASLFSKNALIHEHVSPSQIRGDWDAHMAGRDNSDLLCRYLTLEIWLQQVFNGKFRQPVR